MVKTGRSFLLTISIKNLGGISQNGVLEKELLKVVQRADYYHCVCETKFNDPASRHLHAQLFYTNSKSKGDIKKNYIRVLRTKCIGWDEQKMNPRGKDGACHLSFAYNDVYDNYLDSENEDKSNDVSELLLDKVPINFGIQNDDFYPTEEEQESFKDKANAIDKKFYKWEQMWIEYENFVDEPDIVDIAKFLRDMMFKSRKIQVIVDMKARKQNTACLLAYIQKGGSIKNFLTKEEYDFYILKLEMEN